MNTYIAPLAIERRSRTLNFNRVGRSPDFLLCHLSIAALVIYAWLFGVVVRRRIRGRILRRFRLSVEQHRLGGGELEQAHLGTGDATWAHTNGGCVEGTPGF